MTEYLPVIINAALTLIVGVLARKLKAALDRAEAEREKQEREFATVWGGLQEGLKVLLRNQLLENYQAARQRGKITYDEADAWEAMYHAYHNLGGNGVIDGIHDSFRRFPVGPEAEVYPQEARQ